MESLYSIPVHWALGDDRYHGNSPPLHRIVAFNRTSKWLCLFTTFLTFMLGVGVGVTLPIIYSSTVANETNNTLSQWSNGHNSPAAAAVNLPLNSTRTERFPSRSSLRKKNYLPLKEEAMKKTRESNRKSTPSVEEEPAVANVVTFIEPKMSFLPMETNEEADGITTTVSGEAVQGIFWSQNVEDVLPTGFERQEDKEWSDFSHRNKITRLQEGCGRTPNRLITFENGRQSCARYRQNNDQIQGEIFSFYLSRLLGIRNLPPSSLGLVRPRDRQWINVQSSLSQAQWKEDRPVVYTQFLNDLEPAYIPEQFRRNRQLNPSDVNQHHLQESADRIELIALAQWSDLLVFDYLTANLDRMVNNLYNMQWNPTMMDSPAHNLFRDSRTGLLVFLDNESGLLHGYRLLDKYEVYHKKLLDSLCVFRRSTVESLRQLKTKNNLGSLLRQMFESRDQSLVDFLPFLPEESIKTLNYRVDRVLDQVAKCQSLYGS